MRVTSAIVSKKRHKKVLKRAKGFYSLRSKNYKTARQAVRKAMAYSTRDRKQRQRRMRCLWIMRINAAARSLNISYSVLINLLKKGNVLLNRKSLSELAINDFNAFAKLVESVRVA